MTVIPRAVAEEGVIPVPLVNVYVRFGLTERLFLSGRANALYVTNQLFLGMGWTEALWGLNVSVEDHVGFWFGFADFEGFDAASTGLGNYPSVTLGLRADDLAMSLRTEALIAISQHTYFGTASVGRVEPTLAGLAFTLGVEQELWNGRSFLFGVRFQYSLPSYQSWLAFSAFNRWLIFPEVFVGYEL